MLWNYSNPQPLINQHELTNPIDQDQLSLTKNVNQPNASNNQKRKKMNRKQHAQNNLVQYQSTYIHDWRTLLGLKLLLNKVFTKRLLMTKIKSLIQRISYLSPRSLKIVTKKYMLISSELCIYSCCCPAVSSNKLTNY